MRDYSLTRWNSTEDERKLWCQLLPKLHIPEESDELKVKALTVLVAELKEVRTTTLVTLRPSVGC